MNTTAEPPRSNPFSTRFIRPGAVPFLFGPDESAERLVSRLAGQAWRGQIIGPHGSGKSTLLAALGGPLTAAGRHLWHVSLYNDERRLPRGWSQEVRSQQANTIVVDGYEQLAAWQRCSLRMKCRFRGWGLLITAHSDVGLPTIYQTTSDLATARKVVDSLLTEEAGRLTPEQVATAYSEAGGNVREALFRLYDVWDANFRHTVR
jgi:hypothetical protein